MQQKPTTRAPKVERTCPACGASFWRYPGSVLRGEATHCSRACRWKPLHSVEYSADGLTALIPIQARDGSIRVHAIVDRADAAWVTQWRWAQTRGYITRKERVGTQFRTLYLHVELLGRTPGDGFEVDHINRVRHDNRRENLRVIPQAGNRQNMQKRAGTSSQHRGVCWNKARGKWLAYIGVEGRLRNLGLYATEEQAAIVAREARNRLLPYSTD